MDNRGQGEMTMGEEAFEQINNYDQILIAYSREEHEQKLKKVLNIVKWFIHPMYRKLYFTTKIDK